MHYLTHYANGVFTLGLRIFQLDFSSATNFATQHIFNIGWIHPFKGRSIDANHDVIDLNASLSCWGLVLDMLNHNHPLRIFGVADPNNALLVALYILSKNQLRG